MTTPMGPPRSEPARIGLWGPTASGKTTFLAALQIAITRQSSGSDWLFSGADPASSDFLIRNISRLVDSRGFPDGTYSTTELAWRFVRPDPARRSWRQSLRRVLRRVGQRDDMRQTVFEISMMDADGALFKNSPQQAAAEVNFDEEEEGYGAFDPPEVPADDMEKLLKYLALCDGLVYLFDPLREREHRDAYEFFARTLEQLARRSFDNGRMQDGKLPQYLAVCINKIDDPIIYNKAYNEGYVSFDVDRMMLPEIPNRFAGDLFKMLCTNREAGSADLVHGSIEKYFHPDRVTHFASSAIGFYVGPSRTFQHRDPGNIKQLDGRNVIRGAVLPTNVLEPFLWLEEKIRRAPPPPPTQAPPRVDQS